MAAPVGVTGVIRTLFPAPLSKAAAVSEAEPYLSPIMLVMGVDEVVSADVDMAVAALEAMQATAAAALFLLQTGPQVLEAAVVAVAIELGKKLAVAAVWVFWGKGLTVLVAAGAIFVDCQSEAAGVPVELVETTQAVFVGGKVATTAVAAAGILVLLMEAAVRWGTKIITQSLRAVLIPWLWAMRVQVKLSALAAVLVEAMVAEARFVSFGPVQPVHSHRQIQGTFK